jgi:hypothetical protein
MVAGAHRASEHAELGHCTTAAIDGRQGLVLVEAKAHSNELKVDGYGARSSANMAQIRSAVAEANNDLRTRGVQCNLTCDSHYQLANRFAWSWKLAALGTPVVLVYLGFLNAAEMRDKGEPFTTAEAWENAVHLHSKDIVPESVWGNRIEIRGTPIVPLIRSLQLPLPSA